MRARLESQRSACGPASDTRVSPPEGSRRSRATRSRGTTMRVPATRSVTGADAATRSAATASASSPAVVSGAARTTGSATDRPRSSDASAATTAADAATPIEAHTGARRGRLERETATQHTGVHRRSVDLGGDPRDSEPNRRRVGRDQRLDIDDRTDGCGDDGRRARARIRRSTALHCRPRRPSRSESRAASACTGTSVGRRRT